MFSGFPTLSLAKPAEKIDMNKEKSNGCVLATELKPIEVVNLTYPALCHLLHLSQNATRWRKVCGNTCGIQIDSTVEISEVMIIPPETNDDADRERDDDGPGQLSYMIAKRNKMLHNEELDTYKVGQFTIGNINKSIFSNKLVNELLKMYKESQPCLFLMYDPFRTGLLGKPHIRAFTLTSSYIAYSEESERTVKNTQSLHRIVKESGITKNGVLREVPVHIAVDAYHTLGLCTGLTVPPIADDFDGAFNDSTGDYIEALLHDVRDSTEDLAKTLAREEDENEKHKRSNEFSADAFLGFNAPLGQSPETVLKMMHLREQAQHLEAICDGILLNSCMLREL